MMWGGRAEQPRPAVPRSTSSGLRVVESSARDGVRRREPTHTLRGALTRWDVTGMLKRKPWMKSSDGMSRMDFGPNIC